MASYGAVMSKMESLSAAKTMNFERTSKCIDMNAESAIDMLMRVKCRKSRDVAHYHFDCTDYKARLGFCRVAQSFITADDMRLLGSSEIMQKYNLALLAEVIADDFIGKKASIDLVPVVAIPVFNRVKSDVAEMLTGAISDMMRDEE